MLLTIEENKMNSITCGFIGLGLIGGSIAKAIKKVHSATTILAYDIDKIALHLALNEGIINEAHDSLGEAFNCCDFLFLCAPVSKNDENLKLIKKFLKKDCILTDVGSVKNTIHETIAAEGLEHCFIGGHPMAGSEKIGYTNSSPLLLENAYYILTPTPSVSQEKVTLYKNLVASFGAIPLILDYKEHDYITAAISHLPHVIAASLVNLIHDSDNKDGLMKLIAAGGFKDITRIASSSPTMWQHICLTNTNNIIRLLKDYIHSLSEIETLLINSISPTDSESRKQIYDLFDHAKSYRDSFQNTSSGPIKKSHYIHLEVPDESGSIARTAVILANASINIKNIGILHSREFEEGALKIEFYEESSKISAITLLKQNNYKIYTV